MFADNLVGRMTVASGDQAEPFLATGFDFMRESGEAIDVVARI